MIVRHYNYHNPRCDCCGLTLAGEKDDETAAAAMTAAGWERRTIRDGSAEQKTIDICPLCRRKERESGELPRPMNFWEYTKHMRVSTFECTGKGCPFVKGPVKRCTAPNCPYRTKPQHAPELSSG